jgi:predicted kinase
MAHLLKSKSWWHAQSLLHEVVEVRSSLGLTTCVDATNLWPGERARLLDIARQFGLSATVVLVCVSVDRAMKRNAARPLPLPEDQIIACLRRMGEAIEAVHDENWDEIVTVNT